MVLTEITNFNLRSIYGKQNREVIQDETFDSVRCRIGIRFRRAGL